MKLILLNDPEFKSNDSNEINKLENSFVLINLDHVQEITVLKESGQAIVKLQDKIYYVTKEELIDCLKLINDAKIIRSKNLDKIYREIKELL